jgi:hypothetical protein|tara:strand:+ start:2303 stop:4162 length:1860 start_codon:yes stop_codon:yes gene_type:complete
MGYIDDALDEVKRATPTSGVNVCIYDDFEDVGDKLETIGNFDTVEEAQNFIDNYDGDAELVMYEAEVYEAEELNTQLPSYTPQKNHSISNYISMAEDDYEKGTTRSNDEYEKINYRSDSKFNAPHRTIYEEKLNKDGTGVRRATRGLNPKKTKAKSLTFVYVSKSECDICRQYDGKTFATDSPDRPIIPRLESQGKKGTRPYTHPNCKCKWVKPFSDAYMKNFDEIGMKDSDNINFLKTSNEDYDKVKTRLYKKAIKKYGDKFYNLPKSRKHYIIMHEIMKELKANESADPITALPVISMLKMTFDAIQPTLALQLNKMKHHHVNEVRELINNMVGESLTSERKHEIVIEHNLDFTFENLLDLTAVALFEALNEEEKIGMDVELEFTDDEEKAKDTVEDHLEEDPEHYSRLKSVFEHDVWDEETNKLVDPSLLEDNEESKASENDEQYMPDVYNIDPYPHRHEFIDNVCVICDYVLKATEIYTEEDEIKRLDKQNNELAGILSRMNASKIEMLKIDIRWEQKRLEDIENNIHPDEFYELYNERVKAQLLSHSKRKLESKKQELKELTGESKAIEGGRGSGRKGHQKWMLGAEADPEECPNCMIFTEKKNGNCQICGNSY